MNILIIEDSRKHQAAARAQFPEATIVNYDEAYRLLEKAHAGDYSAILTDLHFVVEGSRTIPSAPFSTGNNFESIGRQLPFGLAFVLKGVELGIPVALVSDVDHHSDLMTGLLDMMGHVVRPRGKRAEVEPRHFVKGSGHGPEAFSWDNRLLNPRFVLLRDMCPKAEDMHWNGEEIVLSPKPDAPSYKDEVAWEKWCEMPVKDWRESLRLLTAVLSES